MKNKKKAIIALIAALVAVLAATGAVYAATAGSSAESRQVSRGGWTTATSIVTTTDTTNTPVHLVGEIIPLTDTEQAAIVFLREEEKLARDVYNALYSEWGARVFSNIARSESRHMASMETLIDTYGLTDPVTVDTPGVFTNPELQTLYTQLVAKGSGSLQDAYEVGVTIETLDIGSLEALLALNPAQVDVVQVMQNLLSGSQNHLASFTRLAD